jgi:hypothetical protein
MPHSEYWIGGKLEVKALSWISKLVSNILPCFGFTLMVPTEGCELVVNVKV